MLSRSPSHRPVSLLFNVSQLLKSEIGQFRSYDFQSDGVLELDDATADGISGHVKFTLTNFGLLAHVHAGGVLHLTCSRCLEPFTSDVTAEFEEEFVPSINIQTGLPSEAPRSDTALPISRNHTVDLGEAIRQEFLLSMDLIPVCASGCLGLCPSCGANRNLEPCSCPPAAPASPFAVLVELIQPIENNEQ